MSAGYFKKIKTFMKKALPYIGGAALAGLAASGIGYLGYREYDEKTYNENIRDAINRAGGIHDYSDYNWRQS